MAHTKQTAKPHWRLTFDVSSDLTVRPDGSTYYTTTAIGQHGEFAYMAEIQLHNWAQDIAAFFDQLRAAYFQVEANGLPDFPDMSTPTTPSPTANSAQPIEAAQDEAAEPQEDRPQPDAPSEPEAATETADGYDITLYDPLEPDNTGEEALSGQPGLF